MNPEALAVVCRHLSVRMRERLVVGLHLPGAGTTPSHARARRGALVATLTAGALLLSGCSDEAARFGFPEPRSEQGEHNLALWQGAWIAALITGVLTWGLIFWAIWRYRRRSDADVPVQTRYNLPLEIFYTIAPVLMVIVFFDHTVKVQNEMLDDGNPTNVIEVTGQQWQWTFNHGIGEPDLSADENLVDDEFAYDSYGYVVGTGSHIPTLVLPEKTTTRFNLRSADVIHNFGVPEFGMKMDVVPGRVNHYSITTKEATATFDPSAEDLIEGTTFRGACYELCGVYHARMIFKVAILSESDYKSYVDTLAQNGFEAERPLLGGGKSTRPADEIPTHNEEEGE